MLNVLRLRHLVFIVCGLILLSFMVFQDWAGLNWTAQIGYDDGPVETMSALFYLFSAIACGLAIYRKQHIPLAILWLVLSILFLGEETSWFQRYIGYSVPYIEGQNAQSEFNIHNLKLLMDHSYGFFDENLNFTFEPRTLLTSQYLFRIGFFLFFLVLPVMVSISIIRKASEYFSYVRPSAGFLIAAWSVITVSFFVGVPLAASEKALIVETREMFYALVIFLYCTVYILKPDFLKRK